MKCKYLILSASLGFAAFFLGLSPASAADAPPLGAAESFAVLGGSTVTNTGATIVTGDLGVSTPGVACTGFVGCTTTGLGKVIGTIYVNPASGPENQAQLDAATAYGELVGQACDVTYGAVAEIGGLTLNPGVHCFPSSVLVNGKLTLNGGPTDVYVFKVGSTLTTGTESSVVFPNGVDTNVFWAIGSSATLGTRTAFTGNILAVASITITAGASVSGRALAGAAVTMDTNTVASTCPSAPCAHPLPPPPRPIDVSQFLIDHFQCYDVRSDDKGKDKFKPTKVVLQDQFGKSTVTLRRASLICAPTVKDRDPKHPVGKFPDDLRNAIDHLVCYEIYRGGSGGKGDLDVLVHNQFGEYALDVAKPEMLCVPSLKTLVDDDDHHHDHDGDKKN